MPQHTAFPSLAEHLGRQCALGRSATRVDLMLSEEAGSLTLRAGPRAVLVGQGQCSPVPWQLYPQAELDQALRRLHARILEEAHDLPDLLGRAASADPEARPARAVQGRLQRMLALRSVLELAAAWEDASVPGAVAPGWSCGPNRHVAVLPWHTNRTRVGDGWYLHHLRRWHRPFSENWAEGTAGWIVRGALLQDVGPGNLLTAPLSSDLKERQQDRATPMAPPAPPCADSDPDAFVRRVRLALSAVLEPALGSFEPEAVLGAVQGARSGVVALSRLLPGVAAGPVQALGAKYRQWWGRPAEDGARPARAAGLCPVRRSSWTAARAANVYPSECLAAEAAAGPLHLLVPGLQHAGPTSPVLRNDRLSPALEEVRDLFTAVSALPATQELPLPDLSGLLTGRGFLRLGAHAPPDALASPQDPREEDVDWQHEVALALLSVPGMTEAVRALQTVQARREQELVRVRNEVCLLTGLSEAQLSEATGGERPFDLLPGDLALERLLSWTGGVWSVRLARHPEDLVSDGRALSHCVGWGGYAQRVRGGGSRIVRVLARGPEDETASPLLTLELGQVEADSVGTSSWKVVQARGASNRPPTRDEGTLLALWAREVGVRLEVRGAVPPLTAVAARAETTRLAVTWETVPPPLAPGLPQTSDTAQRAAQQLAETTAARWTPAATRVHQEGLRRVAALVTRARSHLTDELLRLHAAGDALLTGTLSGNDLLPGTGELALVPDARPQLQALTEHAAESPRLLGLRIDRRVSLAVHLNLRAHERRQTLDLRPGKRPGDLALHFSADGQAQINSYFDPASLMNTGLLDPLHRGEDGGWNWGVARRRQAGLTPLWSLLDEPLSELERAASVATRQPGSTLREQLGAWTQTVAAQRSLAHRGNRGARRH